MNSHWLFVVTSVSGAQIIKKAPGLVYTTHDKYVISQYYTMWDPGNRPGCHDRQVLSWWPDRHRTNVGGYFFRYINDDVTNQNEQKIWEPKKHNENAEWLSSITRQLDGLEEGPKKGNTRPLTQNNTKKNIKLESARPWWNTWVLVQEIHLHTRKTSTRNEQMLTRRASTWMDDQRNDYINPKGPQ